jgi:hypothetical protein
MKYVFIGLAFCSGAYIVLACFKQGMAGPQSVSVPLSFIMFRAFAVGCIVCCVIALSRITPAVIAIWIAAIAFDIISWRINPTWIFHGNVFYSIWPTLFLTAALLAGKWRGSTRTRHRLNCGHRIRHCETSRR